MAVVPSTSRHCMTQMYIQGGGCTPYLTPNMWPSVKDRGNMCTISYVRDSGVALNNLLQWLEIQRSLKNGAKTKLS